MVDTTPASLDSVQLSRRLGELAGHERKVQVEFLLHLEEYDRRRAWAEAGYPSLWEWCLRILHLREGAAGRRIAAMRVLRRLPRLADALRDGRLSLSTVSLLGPVLTEENCEEVVARAPSGARTWSCSGANAPERVKVLSPAVATVGRAATLLDAPAPRSPHHTQESSNVCRSRGDVADAPERLASDSCLPLPCHRAAAPAGPRPSMPQFEVRAGREL